MAQLTKSQIVRLGHAISCQNMESIALLYLDFEDETIKNIKSENRDNAEAFNREVINRWKNKNAKNQVKVRIIVF